MKDPACVIAVTGEAGVGKSTVVAGVLAELGMMAWIVSASVDDLEAALALIQHRVKPNFVLVIDDAHELGRPVLDGVFDLLGRDRAAMPRLVIIARRPFWSVAERPGSCDPYERIGTVAVLFAMTDAEAEHYLRDTLGLTAPHGAGLTLRAVVQRSQGNARALREATRYWPQKAVASAMRSVPVAKRGNHVVSGAVALIILVLAMVALTMSFVETTSQTPQTLVPRSMSEPRAATMR